MIKILKPRKLHKGDKIRLVAPSFPFPKKSKDNNDYMMWYLRGKKEIEKLGFKIVEGKNLRKTRWWMAETPKERAEDINLMFENKEIKAIIAHDEGHATIDILKHLDYQKIKKNLKPLIIGFSDITNILIAVYKKTGLVGFYMDLLSYTLGNVWSNINDKSLVELGRNIYLKILTSDKPLGTMSRLSVWKCWRKGKSENILFSGNLSMIVSLIGTKYFPSNDELKNSILFLEIDKSPSYRIYRFLYQLKYAGILDIISGMIIGKLPEIKPSGWPDLKEPTPREIVMEIIKDYHFPVIAIVDFGHKNINLPMPIGLKVRMDANKLLIKFMEAAVI